MNRIPPLFDLGKRPLIMGIMNVTPDSFSGDGIMVSDDYVSAAVRQAINMMNDGADILDIGGESSRPGADPISVEEEINRTVPVIGAIREKLGGRIALSIDTTKPAVAEAAIISGVNILNDISGMNADDRLYKLAVDSGAYIVLMHNRSASDLVKKDVVVGGEYVAPDYTDVVADVISDLEKMVERAKLAGVPQNRIIVDPGLGFGKTVEQNLRLINEVDKIKRIGYPVLVGPSRKSFIGKVLNVSVSDRLEGTATAVAISAMRGADILRVHDVKSMSRVVKMMLAIVA
ncbi:MAG: dihydropteroate synthase [Alphaproteobacteria bacterium]|nr:dihydropteroate synthase [Alphaproteobacteria bacterium]